MFSICSNMVLGVNLNDQYAAVADEEEFYFTKIMRTDWMDHTMVCCWWVKQFNSNESKYICKLNICIKIPSRGPNPN